MACYSHGSTCPFRAYTGGNHFKLTQESKAGLQKLYVQQASFELFSKRHKYTSFVLTLIRVVNPKACSETKSGL